MKNLYEALGTLTVLTGVGVGIINTHLKGRGDRVEDTIQKIAENQTSPTIFSLLNNEASEVGEYQQAYADYVKWIQQQSKIHGAEIEIIEEFTSGGSDILKAARQEQNVLNIVVSRANQRFVQEMIQNPGMSGVGIKILKIEESDPIDMLEDFDERSVSELNGPHSISISVVEEDMPILLDAIERLHPATLSKLTISYSGKRPMPQEEAERLMNSIKNWEAFLISINELPYAEESNNPSTIQDFDDSYLSKLPTSGHPHACQSLWVNSQGVKKTSEGDGTIAFAQLSQ